MFANYVGILRSMVKSKLIYLIDALVFCAAFFLLDALLKLIEIQAYLASTLSVKPNDSIIGQFTDMPSLISVVIGVLIAKRAHWLIEGKTLKNSKVELRIGWWYYLIGAVFTFPYTLILEAEYPIFFTNISIPLVNEILMGIILIPYFLGYGLYRLTIKQLTPRD